MAFITRIWPRSIRLAISTSPSRVSSGTVPISRRYMRTGSLVFSSVPGVRSSSTSSPSSPSLSKASPPIFGPPSSRSIPWVPMVVIRSSRSSGDCMSSGEQVVHLTVSEIALLLARIDQFLDIVFVLVFNRQARHVSRVKSVRICLLGSDEMRSRPLRHYPRSEAMSPGGRRTSTKDLQNIMPRRRTGVEKARREPNSVDFWADPQCVRCGTRRFCFSYLPGCA